MSPVGVIGVVMLAATGGLALAITFTRGDLRRFRRPDRPAPLLIGPHNFLEEFDFDTYEQGAEALVRRLRRQYTWLMLVGPIGAMLFFWSQS